MKSLNDIIITDITSAATIYSPKGRFEEMYKRNTYGLSFCTEGQITYTHNNKDFISDNKHIIILPQGQSYTIKGNKIGNFPVINFKCANVISDTFLLFPVRNTASFAEDFEKIKELLLFPENRARIISIFYNMIYKISSGSSVCQTIMPAIQYIEKNYGNDKLTNEFLAEICNISEVYLRKLFLKHLKTTPKQYISEIRLSKAKQLLADGFLSNTAIAEQCGFSSSYNFSRFFKDKTGITPTEYLKQNRIHVL